MSKSNNFATASMAIRRPVEEVFKAFTYPEITSNFWYSSSDGFVKEGAKLNWKWDLYGFTIPVKVLDVKPNRKIVIEWGEGKYLSNLMWEFKELNSELTYVTITNYNLQGDGNILTDIIRDSTSGLAFVLAGLKAWLEHGVRLNLSEDKYPKELTDLKNE
jgi:uncharacterized protein YndB with AHSA1/START domain